MPEATARAALEQAVTIVTGGATGIGLGCARAIVAAGGRVMLCGRRAELLEQAVDTLGDRAAWVAADVTDPNSMQRVVEATEARFGKLSGAVNAAGVGAAGPLLDTPAEQLDTILGTNLVGVFHALRAQGRALRANGGGSIVNIGSIAGTLSHRWMGAYCVSKAGVNMLTRVAADELGEHGIRVNAVLPGLVGTDMTVLLTENAVSRDEYLRRMPISRVGTPDDVAGIVRFLLSDEARWITGQLISVDGGHSLRGGPDLVPLFAQLAANAQRSG